MEICDFARQHVQVLVTNCSFCLRRSLIMLSLHAQLFNLNFIDLLYSLNRAKNYTALNHSVCPSGAQLVMNIQRSSVQPRKTIKISLSVQLVQSLMIEKTESYLETTSLSKMCRPLIKKRYFGSLSHALRAVLNQVSTCNLKRGEWKSIRTAPN